MMFSRNGLAVIRALGKRDLRRYFSNPTGYVFITVFILISAAAAFWRPRFFLNNLANLDQLNEVFPWLLLFFVPAITMGVWADERRQGTDELLLTLPTTEQSIVLGKYLATVGIYTVSLAVSLSHVIVLRWLGHPDGGLLAANYFGYWLMGAAVIPVGMLASLLTANATIAFILGAMLCTIPLGISQAAATVGDSWGRQLAPFSVSPYFGDFTRGIVSLSGILYFLFLALLFLYLNSVVLERRHWRRATHAMPALLHAILRAAALAISFGALVVLGNRTHLRLDLTAEGLYSLSPQTRALIQALPSDHPVFIQAFVAQEVPESLVQTRENLLGILREIEALGGAKVTVAIEATDPYSKPAQLARERYGIFPRSLVDPSTGVTARDLYLGVAATSGADEQVIPFFEQGLSPEYELDRAIRVVAGGTRKRIGIVDTDVKMLGGVGSGNNQTHPAWAAVEELRKQYDVIEVTPADAPTAHVDELLVVQPSRLTQTELDLVLQPIQRGVPTLMLLDPLPMVDVQLAPGADLARQVNPYQAALTSRIVYGNIRQAFESLGGNWVPALIVWDGYNPHPDMADLPKENVFVGTGNGNPDAFNRQTPLTAGLQEVLLLYPGYLQPVRSADFFFEPLLQAGSISGSSSFFDLMRPTRSGLAINTSVTREAAHRQYVLAARIRSKKPLVTAPGAKPINLIAIADLDFISDNFFGIRAMASANASFDNITFFLNSVDVLAGDESFIALRNRRARHRTLERLEAQTRTFMERRTREEQQADKEARTALADARDRLKKRVDDLGARSELDVQAKQIMLRNLEETENRQLRVFENNIAVAKDAKVRASRETMEIQIRNIRTRIETLAVLLPPLPVLLVGIGLFVRRTRREREGAGSRLRDTT